MRTVKHFLANPYDILVWATKKMNRIVPDNLYIRIIFRGRMGVWPNLKSPKTFSEKIQWLKLYNRKPEYTMMVDKYAVKDYVAGIIGKEYVIPTLGVWNNANEIEFEKLPQRFVLKCTHDSGGVVICKDKSKLDFNAAREKLNNSLKRDYYSEKREWPYKNVPRRIIAEQYIESSPETNDLPDYKFFCFDGEVKMIQVDYNRFVHHNRNLYTPQWERIQAELGFPSQEGKEFKCPEGLDVAIDAAKKLSKGIPHVRVDFYIVNNKVYFGELTFYHGSGMEKTKPESFNKTMGDWLTLPEKKTV